MTLEKIHASSVACAYAMPKAAPGEVVDPHLVNVSCTPSGAQSAVTLGQVADAASCNANGGWYYDDPNKPSVITLCPATCEMVQADAGVKMQIVLGCATQPA